MNRCHSPHARSWPAITGRWPTGRPTTSPTSTPPTPCTRSRSGRRCSPPAWRGGRRSAPSIGRRGARPPVRIAEIHDVVVHEAADPEVVIGEWEGTGTIEPDGRPFRATGLLTLRVRNGEIVDARDYMDVFGTYHAMGRLKDVVAAAESATATA
ncbi:nuclear transport factor 2 family protein [Microbispora hainanensis]